MTTPSNKLAVKVEGNQLIFYNPNNEIEDNIGVTFHRTLRIPDDGKIYPLPPSLGSFPVKRVDDYLDRVPEAWKKQGGVFIPLYQREAMWLEFMNFNTEYPHAMKIAVGKVNALSGEIWDEQIKQRNVQDYVVTPLQPWLDGINAGDGFIKQFVAMPLGSGYTVEGQVTGEEKVGGTQIIVYSPHHEKRLKQFPPSSSTTITQPKPFTITSNFGNNNSNFCQPPSQPPTSMPQPKKKSAGLSFFSKSGSKSQPPLPPPSSSPYGGMVAQPQCCDLLMPMTCTSTTASVVPPPSLSSSSSSYSSPPPQLQQQEQQEAFHDDFCYEQEACSVPPPMLQKSSNSLSRKKESSHDERKEKKQDSKAKELGLAAGGKMKQQIIEDPYGVSFWDEATKSRIFIHVVNSEMYKEITGEDVPPTPITAQTYSSYNYPWFDFYNEDVGSVGKSNILSQVKTVKEMDNEKYAWAQQDDSSVQINNVKTYKDTFSKNDVRDGDW